MSEGSGNQYSLVSLDALAKPANTLIEKISGAIGTLYAPRHARNMADAEAYALKVAATTRVKISEIERRGLERLVREEGKKQENIETISNMAANAVPANAKPENMDDDWIVHFFEKARIISNADMQKLWSGVLAGRLLRQGDSQNARSVCSLLSIGKMPNYS